MQDIKKGRPRAFPFVLSSPSRQRFEYWKRLLAPFCPYFLRSFTRGSRVSSPSFLRGSLRHVTTSCHLARNIHDGSSRNRAVASRDGRAEPRGTEAYLK